MVFSGAVFLYAFLPLTLAVYALAPQRGRNAVLLIASLLFYAFGEPVYVFLLLLSSVSNWALSLCIERRRGTRTAKLALAVSVLLNLGLLGFFKYADFFLTTVNGLFGLSLPLTGVRLPLGISFYTFQTMSYTIDVYRGHVRPQRNLATFATFVCLFPQLIAGPIVRYSDIEAELHTRRFCLEDIGTGARRFTVGLGKRSCLPMCWASWCPPPGTQRCSVRGSGPWVICCRFILTFLATATWPSASGGCSASRSRRISTIRILPAP